MSWEFVHTGGTSLKRITVQCSIANDEPDNSLARAVECSFNEQCVTASVTVGPVTAGGNYSCLVTAENHVGIETVQSNYLIATTGEYMYPFMLKRNYQKVFLFSCF